VDEGVVITCISQHVLGAYPWASVEEGVGAEGGGAVHFPWTSCELPTNTCKPPAWKSLIYIIL